MTTTLTTALNAEYQKVFPTKADKVTGRRCVTCDSPLVFGATFTATNDFRQWDNYCATCAASTADQIKSLFVRLVATGTDVTDLADVITAYAQGETVATFQAAKIALRDALTAAERAERVETLKLDPTFVGLALATTPGLLSEKDRSFAESLATQWETRGTLSLVARNGGPGQMHYAEKLAAKAIAADGKANVAKPWTDEVSVAIDAAGLIDGYYAVDHVGNIAHQDTTFVRIVTADSGARFMRHMVGGQGETPAGAAAWCLRVIAGIAAQGAVESMRRYGREIHRCGKCHRLLTDLPSRQAGLGPVCAQAF